MRESTTSAAEPAAMPAPAIEPAQRRSTRKRKRDWQLLTKENEKFEAECDKINEACLAAHGRLPETVDEDPYLAEFGGFLPSVIRHGKQRCN